MASFGPLTPSPIGEVFRARLRQFPSLVNCCTIDWFNEWPAEALESVATKFLNEIDQESVNYDWLTICFYEALLEHGYAYSFTFCLQGCFYAYSCMYQLWLLSHSAG